MTKGTRLEDKVCIITGSGSGMGRAAALLFAAEGAKVVGCDINPAGGESTLNAVRERGGTMVSMHPCDMSIRTDVDKLMRLASDTYGGIDVLYNNGSMAYFAWLPEMTYELWSKTLREELDLVFHACQAVFPYMIERGGGSIINVGSISAHVALKVLPAVAHMAAKGGVVAMSKQIAMEGGKHQIRCNTISPGLVETAQTKVAMSDPQWMAAMLDKLMLGRAGQPEDIAPLVLYLASDESKWVTAADFAIDGGTTGW